MRKLLSRLMRAISSAWEASQEDHPHHGHGPHAHPHAHGGQPFQNAEQWVERLEGPGRDVWQRPDEVIIALQIPHGGRVAEVGAGTGYFPVKIARARPDLTVLGVDREPDMVRFLNERAQREQLPNLQAVQGSPDHPKLPQPVDLVLLVNAYHHVENRPAYFSSLAGSLLPGGRVAIIEFHPDSPMAPPHKLSKGQVVEELRQAGYRLATEHDFLPEQYLLVFARSG